MFKNLTTVATAIIVTLLLITLASAAPGLQITAPPVNNGGNTGPSIDPPAEKGQWFLDLRSGEENVRTHEFYDNVHNEQDRAGGGWMSYFAIQGQIAQIFFDAQGNIVAFDIWATITNDMPALSPWLDGSNSHDEFLSDDRDWEVDMLNVKMTIEFADDGILGNFPMVGYPYFPAPWPIWIPSGVSIESNIYAIEYDQLGWYCWTPHPDDPQPSDGQYMVPTWDFGDIPLQMSASRMLQFGLYEPAMPGTDLYNWLIELQYYEDVLQNRTTSLKISQYFDGLYPDIGIPYPEEPLYGSDCSVFFNIEEEEPPDPPELWDVERMSNGDITLTWLGNPAWTYRVEESTSPYDYNESLMIWTTVANGIPGAPIMIWADVNPPPMGGPEKYYRIYSQNGLIETVCPDTAGAMFTTVLIGRNLVSCMFEPYPPGGGIPGASTLDKMIGNQLTGHIFNPNLSDNIETWNNPLGLYERAWYNIMTGIWINSSGGGPPLFGWDADVGYWVNILATHSDAILVQCGRVSKVVRNMIALSDRNLLGSCFPIPRLLNTCGLITSGFTGHLFNSNLSDNLEFWNRATTVYERAWYKTMGAGGWFEPNGTPWVRPIFPGDAFWLNVTNGRPGFPWTYPVPPGYN